MKLSFIQLIFLIILFILFFSKNLSIINKFVTFIESFIRYLKKYNSIRK